MPPSAAMGISGLATGVGALLVFFIREVSDRFLDASLGFAAGVMLAATSFSLLVPAIEIGGIWKTVIGMILGTVFLIYTERFVPHLHRVTGIKGSSTQLNKMWLFILAITIHNFPEGMAEGIRTISGT